MPYVTEEVMHDIELQMQELVDENNELKKRLEAALAELNRIKATGECA